MFSMCFHKKNRCCVPVLSTPALKPNFGAASAERRPRECPGSRREMHVKYTEIGKTNYALQPKNSF